MAVNEYKLLLFPTLMVQQAVPLFFLPPMDLEKHRNRTDYQPAALTALHRHGKRRRSGF
jgi:hypothetical protein